MTTETKRMNADQLRLALAQCTGTTTWYRHPFWGRHITYTEGAQLFFNEAGAQGAYWLLDILLTEVAKLAKRHPFIQIVMTVENEKATIVADDGNDNELWRKRINYTDCQPGEWRFYLTDNVILLPSEY